MIPGPEQWLKESTAARIQSLAWELPCFMDVTIKKRKEEIIVIAQTCRPFLNFSCTQSHLNSSPLESEPFNLISAHPNKYPFISFCLLSHQDLEPFGRGACFPRLGRILLQFPAFLAH